MGDRARDALRNGQAVVRSEHGRRDSVDSGARPRELLGVSAQAGGPRQAERIMMLSEALAVLASYYTHLRLPSGRIIPLPPEPERDGAAEFGLEPRGEGLCLVNRCTSRVVGVALEQ